MTTNQLKLKSDRWHLAFNLAIIVSIITVFLPNWVYFLSFGLLIFVGFRTKKWNDAYCDQRDEEYWQNRKDQFLKGVWD